jgi:hypothetical protein
MAKGGKDGEGRRGWRREARMSKAAEDGEGRRGWRRETRMTKGDEDGEQENKGRGIRGRPTSNCAFSMSNSRVQNRGHRSEYESAPAVAREGGRGQFIGRRR